MSCYSRKTLLNSDSLARMEIGDLQVLHGRRPRYRHIR